MKHGMVIVLAMAVGFGTAAYAAESKGGGTLDAAKKGIDKGNAALSEAVDKHDAAAMAALYTTDAVVFPPDQSPISGRAAIEEFWKGSLVAGVSKVQLTTTDVERSGDLAVESGTFAMTVKPSGKEAQTAHGKYVVVWKHQKDGSWKLHRDIWNGTPEAK